MQKSGLKTGGYQAIFSVLEDKRSKLLQKLNKRDCFCLFLDSFFYGVSHAKTNSHNRYMI